MANLSRINRKVLDNTGDVSVSSQELAEIFGLERTSIYVFDKNYGMPKLKRDKYDAKACCKWYIQRLKQSSKTGSDKLNEERIILTKAKARKAKVESDILAGSAVYLSDIEQELVIAIGKIKDSLNNLTGTLANDVANINTPSEAYERIDSAISEALNNLAKDFEKISRSKSKLDKVRQKVKKSVNSKVSGS